MSDLEEKPAKLRRVIMFCAAASIAAFALALSGWNDKWTLAAAVVAAICIFYAVLLHKKMYDDAMRDSAERTRTLERDLKFYKDIYDLNPSMIFIMNERFRMTDCNNASLKFLGPDDKQSMLEEISNKIEADIPKKTSEDGFTESLFKKMEEAVRDDFSQMHTIIRTRCGTDRNISVAFRKIPAENGFVLVGSATDATELYGFKGELARKNKMLDLINRIAILMSSLDSENADGLVRNAAEIMGRVMDLDRIYLWKNLLIDGRLNYTPEYMWIRPSFSDNLAMMTEEGFACIRSIADWEARFERAECINGPLNTLSDNERERLAPYGIKSILVLPLFLRNKLWGFISFDDCHQERTFAEEEVYILRSASLMIVSSLLRDGVEHERTAETL